MRSGLWAGHLTSSTSTSAIHGAHFGRFVLQKHFGNFPGIFDPVKEYHYSTIFRGILYNCASDLVFMGAMVRCSESLGHIGYYDTSTLRIYKYFSPNLNNFSHKICHFGNRFFIITTSVYYAFIFWWQ